MGYYVIFMGKKGLLDIPEVRRGLCVCSVGATFFGMLIMAWAGEASLATVLPFHLCTVSGLVVPFMVAKKKALPFMYYLGLPCAIIAILMPEMMESKLEFALRVQFMAMHSIIVLAVVWVILVEREPVRPGGVLRSMVFGNILLGCAYLANIWTGGNYMYLAYAPEGTPLVWFGEPGSLVYIAWLEVCALVVALPLSVMSRWTR